MSRPGRPGALAAALLAVAALVLLPAGRAAADGPTAAVDRAEAGRGGSVTVTGAGWRPGALLTLLICGQNMLGGTNDCANADGRAVTVGDDGRFSRKLPVAEPPKPCPCVVHVATVTGGRATADAAFRVAGHPVEPLPPQTGRDRLSVLGARLEGSSGLLTWFGAPPRRKLVVTVGNLGPTPARDPVFRVGTAHGVLAPAWEEQRWRGTVAAGAKARVALDVELAAGAHGDYAVSLEYGGKLLVEQPWDVPRPWGVTLFWTLLCVVVPATVFRAAMAAVAAAGRRRDEAPTAAGTRRRHRAVRAPRGWSRPPSRPHPPGAARPGSGPTSPVRGAGPAAARGAATGTEAAPGRAPGPGSGARRDPAPGPGRALASGEGDGPKAATDAAPGLGSGAAGPGSGTGHRRAVGASHAAEEGHSPAEEMLPAPGAAEARPGAGAARVSGAAKDAAPGAGAADRRSGAGAAPGTARGSATGASPAPAPGRFLDSGADIRPGVAEDAGPASGTGSGAGAAPGPDRAPASGGGGDTAPAPRARPHSGPAAREGLPWFAGDAQPRVSAPSEDGPTKGTT